MTDLAGGNSEPKKGLGNEQWRWLYELFLRPRKIFSEIAGKENRAWLKPMLVLSILTLLLSLAGGPARLTNAQMNVGEMPEDFPYWSEDQQNQYFEGQAEMQGPLVIYVFPLVVSLAALWLGWFLLGNILHLLMTLKGSQQPQGAYLNLAAWSALPFAIRSVVQIIALLATREVISNPGLSGFITAGEDAGAGLTLLRILLGMVDIYSLWFAALVWIGAPIISRLKQEKTWWITVVALVIFVILASLPDFAVAQIGGLGSIRPYLFF